MDLYADHILNHYRNPRNRGTIEGAAYRAREYNPLCGDDIELFFNTDDEDVVTEIKFTNQGCAISTAAVSMLTELVRAKKISDIVALTEEEFLARLELAPTLGRRACALLGFKAFQKAVRGK